MFSTTATCAVLLPWGLCTPTSFVLGERADAVQEAWVAHGGAPHTGCLQAGGLERRHSQHSRRAEDAVHPSLDDDALHGVVLVGDLGFSARGEEPTDPDPPWLATASDMSMGEDW